MPRIARVSAPGIAHHITQRGNNRETIFLDEEERHQYLGLLKKYSDRHGMKVLAYCLMSNHVHILGIPEKADSLGNTLRDTHMRYSQYVNRKYKRSGHLWQGRFFSCPLDNVHILAAARYIERNPVRAELVRRAEEWKWSSARAHISDVTDELLSEDTMFLGLVNDWREFINEPDDMEVVEILRKSTRTGRPLGNKGFVTQIENFLSRVLRLKKAGRPPKKKNE